MDMTYKKFPLISIVMLNFNGLTYLKQTIKAILRLNYPNYEFIVVDNGSTDGSIDYIKKEKRVRLLKSPKLRAKNFACNYAISNANGEYILLLDNDALITDPDILIELIKRYTSRDKIGVIGLSFCDRNSEISQSYGLQIGYYFVKETASIPIENLVKYDNTKITFPEGKGLFIKKSIWTEVGGYDDYLIFGGDDNDLGIKLILFGYVNLLFSKTIQTHLGLPERQNNVKYALKWKEMFYAHLYTIVKNYSFMNMLVAIFIYTIYGFLKSTKQAFYRRHLPTFWAFFKGYYLFLKNLPMNVKKRKFVQSKRVYSKDIFLNLERITNAEK